jgi:hypothetical protein
MTEFKEYMTKEKWRIRFVPWSESETGIMVAFKHDPKAAKILQTDENTTTTELTMEESRQFSIDVVRAMVHRFDIEFPNDIEPKSTADEVLQKFEDILNKVEKRYTCDVRDYIT